MGLKEIPDYTEELVGFAIESFLSVSTFPHLRYTIEPLSKSQEREDGVDGILYDRVRFFKPFYMQFKRPFSYPAESTSKIIADRKSLRLEVEPKILYFELREKKATHLDYQHNMLYKLRQRLLSTGEGDAAYVCPLFMRRDAYRTHLHLSAMRNWFGLRWWKEIPPWRLEEILFNLENNILNFENIPTLREHISIPPHALVKNAKHKYSFTEKGQQLCFHSPIKMEEQPIVFDEWLNKLNYNFSYNKDVIYADTAARSLQDLIYDLKVPLNIEHFKGQGLKAWLSFGQFLKREFDIHQYAFIRWD